METSWELMARHCTFARTTQAHFIVTMTFPQVFVLNMSFRLEASMMNMVSFMQITGSTLCPGPIHFGESYFHELPESFVN